MLPLGPPEGKTEAGKCTKRINKTFHARARHSMLALTTMRWLHTEMLRVQLQPYHCMHVLWVRSAKGKMCRAVLSHRSVANSSCSGFCSTSGGRSW